MMPLYRVCDMPNWIRDSEGKLSDMTDKGYLMRIETSDCPIYGPVDHPRMPETAEELAGRVEITVSGAILVDKCYVIRCGKYVRYKPRGPDDSTIRTSSTRPSANAD